jgi:hypothetical protein
MTIRGTDADDFVNQDEPVYGLRSRAIHAARAIEAGEPLEVAAALYDMVALVATPPPPPLIQPRPRTTRGPGRERAEAKRAADLAREKAIVVQYGSPAQRNQHAGGTLPKADLDALMEQALKAALPAAPNLQPFARLTVAHIEGAHSSKSSHRPMANDHLNTDRTMPHGFFRSDPHASDITDAQFATMKLVKTAHPTATVTLLRHEAECEHCGITVTSFGVRAEQDGLKREYAVHEGNDHDRCPTCTSPDPARHPAVQHEGEVQVCSDPWHTAR